MTRIKILDHANRRVIELARGDIVRVGDYYAVVDGFFSDSAGRKNIRVGFPGEPAALQRWAQRNPHRVKDLRFKTRDLKPLVNARWRQRLPKGDTEPTGYLG